MTRINIYDCDAQTIEAVADENDVSVAEIVEMLLEYLDDAKSDNGLN